MMEYAALNIGLILLFIPTMFLILLGIEEVVAIRSIYGLIAMNVFIGYLAILAVNAALTIKRFNK